MRILLISVDFPPHCDGVSRLSYHYARRLAERGHRVVVVAPWAPSAKAGDSKERFRALRFPGYSFGWLRLLPFALWTVAALVSHRPQVIFPMNIGYGGVLSLLWTRLFRCNYVPVAYAYEFLKFRKSVFMRALYNAIYRRGLFTLAVSQYTKNQLVEFGVSAKNIRVVYPGVDVGGTARSDTAGSTRSASATASGWVIGTCGRLIHRKGIDRVIEALPEIVKRFPDIRYRIAGDGPLRNELEEQAARRGVRANVEFAGTLSEEGLPDFYASLDLFVLPARADMRTGHAEGFGIVYLEAALQGVPSVGTATGGIPEAVLDGVTGRLVEGDVESAGPLAQAILGLLQDPATLRRMGNAARERVVRQFDWNGQVDTVERWLRQEVPRGDDERR